MAHTRVLNTDDGSRPKLSRAKRLIELHLYCWVEEGISIRKLSLAESIKARAKQAADREPLPFAEIPGLRFDAPDAAIARESRMLAYEASLFVAEVA